MRKPKDLIDWLLIVVVALCAFRLVGDGGFMPVGPQVIAAVIIEESTPTTPLTQSQVEALNSPEALAYMQGKGYTFWRRIDPDVPSGPPEVMAAIAGAEGVEHPALVVLSEVNRVLHAGHVAGPDDVLPILKRYGGE